MHLIADLHLKLGTLTLEFCAETSGSVRLGIIGKSGSGKTTLLRLIAGLEDRATGLLSFNGQTWVNAKKIAPPQQRNIALVSQEAALFPHLTIQQNLNFAIQISGTTAEEDMSLIGKLGVLPWLHKKPGELSGGQRQRVAITRALLQHPSLLLLDEPFSALDSETRVEMMNIVMEVTESNSIPMVLVSHSMAEIAQMTEHVWLISGGKVIDSDSTNKVLAKQLTITNVDKQDIGSALPFYASNWNNHDQLMQLKLIDAHHQRTEVISWLPVNNTLVEKELMLRVSAHDIVVTRDAIANSSFQNSFTGVLTNVKTRASDVLLTLSVYGHSLHAIVSIRAQRQLAFKVGDSVFAYVKAMSLAFDEYR